MSIATRTTRKPCPIVRRTALVPPPYSYPTRGPAFPLWASAVGSRPCAACGTPTTGTSCPACRIAPKVVA